MQLRLFYQYLLLFCALLILESQAHGAFQISGKVSQFSKPVKFQKVYFVGSGVDTSVTTDFYGEYSITLYPSNTNGIILGFTKNCLGDTLSLFKEYEPFNTTARINFKLCESVQTTVVKGTVKYNGKPLPNTIVRIALNSPNNKIDSVITDSKGMYIKTIASPGSSSGLLYASIMNCDDQVVEKSIIYSVNDTSEFDFTYCAGGNFNLLFGRVINEEVPIRALDFTLQLYLFNPASQQLEFVEEKKSLIDGVFQFILNKRSKYILKALPKNGMTVSPQYYGNTLYWNEAKVIDFSNDTIKAIDIPVPLLFTANGNSDITGKIVDNRENSPSLHALYLMNSSNEIIDYVTCSKRGSYQFKTVPAGNYSIYTDVVGLPTKEPSFTLEPNTVLADYNIVVNRQEVSYEKTTGLTHNFGISNSILTYPNPFKNELKIESQNEQESSIVIENITGRTIYKATISPKSTSNINTTLWERGIYVIYRVENGKVLNVSKTIKQ